MICQAGINHRGWGHNRCLGCGKTFDKKGRVHVCCSQGSCSCGRHARAWCVTCCPAHGTEPVKAEYRYNVGWHPLAEKGEPS